MRQVGMTRLILMFSLFATGVFAEARLGAEAFDALTRGRTVVYSVDGQFHGMERHLGDRRVEWAFADGECHAGRWYERGDNICFVYENLDGPQCWLFTGAPGGFNATFIGEDGPGLSYSAQVSDAVMTCEGPMVGV